MQLETALRAGDLAAVKHLVEGGVDPQYVHSHNYDALIDAVHGRSIQHDEGLLDLLRYLIEQDVELSRRSTYDESGLSVLSRLGRFDAVALLLDAGADECLLEWTPLHRSAALGTTGEMMEAATCGGDLEVVDRWSRTPYLVALASGSIAKAQVLLDAGASPNALAHCGAPGIFMPIRSGCPEVLAWLLAQAFTQVDQTDEFGGTALIEAAEHDEPECVDLLLKAGARIDHDCNGTALSHAISRPVAMRLLEAAADPADADQRVILGWGEPKVQVLKEVSDAVFHGEATRVFGNANPQRMSRPFWEAMIRDGINAYQGGQHFGFDNIESDGPVWCAQRFGQSLTLLPDGRAVQIGGEHEDYYDPDFCIYNDVFVHESDGRIGIYGYPEADFPATDFHTATLLGDTIVVIGRLGYHDHRDFGATPVYRLHLDSWHIELVETHGHNPGWIFKHRAELIGDDEIRVWGGEVAVEINGEEQHKANPHECVLDTRSWTWREL